MSNISDEQKKPHAFQTDGCNGRRIEMEADKKKTLRHLRNELIKHVDVMDEFEVEKLESIVAEIEKIEDSPNDFNATAAFENFGVNILPKAVQQESTLLSIEEKAERRLAKVYKRSNTRHKFAKIASVAASIFVIIMASNVVTIVLADFNIFKPLISWTTETFTIKTAKDIQNPAILESGMKVYSDFKYFLRDYGENFLLPSYIPKEYEITGIRVMENLESELVSVSVPYASKDNDENTLVLRVDVISNSPYETNSLFIEKDNSDVREFSVGKIDCYIFQNTSWSVGVWNDGNYVYSVSADLPFDEIEKIVRSSIQH